MASLSLPGQVARTRRFSLGVPRQFSITADGSAVLFLRSRAGDDPVSCLWALDTASGAERLLADPAELLQARPPAPSAGPFEPGTGIGGYGTDQAGRVAAFALRGDLWTVGVGSGCARLLPTAGPVAGPRPDSGGHRIVYSSGGTLRVIDADGTGDRLLAAPESADVTFGLPEAAGAVALHGTRGYWWAPDGGKLLAARVDSSAVNLWHASDPAEPGQPPRASRYPAAGTANAVVTLWILGLGGSRIPVRWDAVSHDGSAFEYVVGAGWDVPGPYAVVQSRDQCTVRFLGIDPGSGQTSVLAEQRDPCWVQLVPGLPARTGSGAIVTHTDRTGTRQLTVGGTAVTPAGLQLRSVACVDDEDVLFTATAEPTETHVWAYRAGLGIQRLSTEPGVHTGIRRGGTLVQQVRGMDRPAGRVRVRRAGQPGVAIASLAERPVLGVHVTRLVLGPRDLRAALYLPCWHRRGGGPLPVLLDPYGGPSLQRVTAELDWRSLTSQWFADQGFAVLVTDGAGTPGRGPAWEREIHGDRFGPVIDDQVTALHEAVRRHRELDPGRAGIRGWSFGGSLAAMAVLRRPDVFRCAVAGAAVTDQRLHNTHWEERFLGHPGQFPERYQAGSLILAAAELTRPLLLIHGLADENVYPVNTLRLSSALVAARRPHEVLLLPGIGHQAIGSPVTESVLRHEAGFFRRHLGVKTADEVGGEASAAAGETSEAGAGRSEA